MGTLTLNGLQYTARHGVYDKERREGNRFEVDLEFTADFTAAALDDDLTKSIDYEQAEKVVKNVMSGSPVHLIETLAHRIGTRLIETFPSLEKLEVCVRKLNPPFETPCHYSEIRMSWPKSS